jgi:hypothetical protein
MISITEKAKKIVDTNGINTTVTQTWKELRQKLFYNKTVKHLYEGRWVWYHTILVVELFLIIIIQLLILAKI